MNQTTQEVTQYMRDYAQANPDISVEDYVEGVIEGLEQMEANQK